MTMTFRIRDVNELAVRAPARHATCRPPCRSRPMPTATRWRTSVHQRRGDQPDAAGRCGWHAGEREPAHSVHDGRHQRSRHRGDLHGYDDRWLPGAPAGGQRPEDGRRSTSRPGRTCGSTATRSTSKSRARRWSPASNNALRLSVAISRAPRGNARRLSHHLQTNHTCLPPFSNARRQTSHARRVTAFRAPPWLREPLLHFIVLGGCCSASITSLASRADDPHTHRRRRRGGPRRRSQDLQGRARPRAERGRSCTRCAASGSTTKCCIAKASRCGRQGRHRDPRARDLQGAERGRRQRQAADDRRGHAARVVREPSRQVRRAGALRLRGGRAVRRQLREPRCARFVDGAERRRARRREGRPARVQGPAARRTSSQSYGAEFAKALEAAPAGEWQALQTRDGWRAMRLELDHAAKPAVFEVVRGVVLQDWTDAVAVRAAQRRGARADQEVQGQVTARHGAMRALARGLALLLLAFGVALRRQAHEMTMAEMEVRETAPGEFLWQWGASDRAPDGRRAHAALARGLCRRRRACLRCGEAGPERHAVDRGRRQALLRGAGEGVLARRPEPRLHAHRARSRRCSCTARPTTSAAWARSRAPTWCSASSTS